MENEFSRTADALPGLVWTALPDGRIEFVNQRWCDYTGLSVEQAANNGWQSVFHADDRAAVIDRWRASVASGEPRDMQARIRRFDGVYRWFLCRANSITDDAGRIVKWCGINTDIEDRKRAEDALHEHQQRFELIVNSLPTRVVLFNPDGEMMHANRCSLESSGMTLEELKAWQTNGMLHPRDQEAAITRFCQSFETGQAYDAESRYRGVEGLYRWFRVQGYPLRDNDNQIALWYFVQTDIDDRKRAEALLAAGRRVLERIVTGSALPTILEDLCLQVEDLTDGCLCSISVHEGQDMAPEYVGSQGLPRCFEPGTHGCLDAEEYGPGGMAASLKSQVIVSDFAAETRWTKALRECALEHGLRSCWATPIVSRTHELLGTFSLFGSEPGDPTPFQRDLIGRFAHVASIAIERSRNEKARERADVQLRKSAALMAKVEQLSSSGSFSWRPEPRSVTMSDQLRRMFQFEPGVPITRAMIMERYHPADRHLLRELLERAHEGRDFEREHRLLLADGSVMHLHIQAHATRDVEGRLEYIGAAHDMTERRRSEEALSGLRAELAHLSRVNTMGALTASIAHEINQPLAGILTNASTGQRMLSADPPNVQGALETVRRTIRDGHRASDVIKRLRALFTNQTVTTASLDLIEAVREVIELLRGEMRNKRIALRLIAADELPRVLADRVQLQQVVLNLLLNAMDAMAGVDNRPRDVQIRIERDERAGVELAVTDAGVGFDAQQGDKLFEAFFTTKREGMGIGLSVSRRIIESHGGSMWATSNAGHGATFAFSIPCEKDGATGDDDPSVTTGRTQSHATPT